MDHSFPTAADYATHDARDAQDKVRKLEARVAKLENDIRNLAFLVTGKASRNFKKYPFK